MTLFIATASHSGDYCGEFVRGILSSAASIGGMEQINGCADIRLARACLVAKFLKSMCDRMLFIDSDIGFTDNDVWVMHKPLTELVVAEYPRKQEEYENVKLGLGFCLITREVFGKLDALNQEDGSPIIQEFMWKGELIKDYFISGPQGPHYHTEDAGFFLACKLAGVVPHFETRTNLTHTGRKTWTYQKSVTDSR